MALLFIDDAKSSPLRFSPGQKARQSPPRASAQKVRPAEPAVY